MSKQRPVNWGRHLPYLDRRLYILIRKQIKIGMLNSNYEESLRERRFRDTNKSLSIRWNFAM
jgi:hypothetical protein